MDTLCSEHFLPECFISRRGWTNGKECKAKLHELAIPTLFNDCSEPVDIFREIQIKKEVEKELRLNGDADADPEEDEEDVPDFVTEAPKVEEPKPRKSSRKVTRPVSLTKSNPLHTKTILFSVSHGWFQR